MKFILEPYESTARKSEGMENKLDGNGYFRICPMLQRLS
jgi:hypothetical protein